MAVSNQSEIKKSWISNVAVVFVLLIFLTTSMALFLTFVVGSF